MGSFSAGTKSKMTFSPAWAATSLVLTLVSAAGSASAQAAPTAPEGIAVGEFTLTPSLQLRARGEGRSDPVDMGGRNANPATAQRVRGAWLVSERARVGLGAERGALRAQLTLQDARAWGAPSGFGVFAPFEAYAEAHTSSARPSYLRVGRQAVQWGDGRLIGVSDWHPMARALDAVRGRLALGPVDIEALAALLDQSQPASPSFGQTGFSGDATGTQLYGLMAGWSLDPLLRVEATALARVSRSLDTSVGNLAGNVDVVSRFGVARAFGETYTGDLRVSGEARGFRYGLEGAYQLGTARQFGVDRAAYAAAAHAGYTFEGLVMTPTVRVGGSLASGDDSSGDYKQFDPLLPDVHTHYGAMDVFSWSNIAEVNARVSVVPFTDVTFGLEYRYARLMEASGEWLNNYLSSVGRAPGSAEAELGHEGDVFLSWLPWSPLDLRAGYSVLVLGDGARTVMAAEARGEAIPNGSFAPSALSHFAYLQATLVVP
jgi:hypothetical protein